MKDISADSREEEVRQHGIILGIGNDTGLGCVRRNPLIAAVRERYRIQDIFPLGIFVNGSILG